MTIEEITALFQAAYQKQEIITPHNRSCSRPPSRQINHLIYSYKALPVLLSKLKEVKELGWGDDEETDQLERFAVRYIVDATGTLWFAREGTTSLTIPDHTQISRHCLSAGNIYFSQDYQSIIKITNKSGHFEPNPGTLVWTIAALSSAGAKFAATVSLVMHTVNSSIVTELSVEQLLSLLPAADFPAGTNDFAIKISFIDEEITVTDPKDIASTIKQKFSRENSRVRLADSDDDSEYRSPSKFARFDFFPASPASQTSPASPKSSAIASYSSRFPALQSTP